MARMVIVLVLFAACGGQAPPTDRAGSPIPEMNTPATGTKQIGGPVGVVLRDTDGDGDFFDACATQAEDYDGFEDGDGCPERDNDRDGIDDARDACPDAAEDGAAGARYDGCPGAAISLSADLDGDAVARDRCPGAPEDVDGFEDDDGCPDPDNDGDGLLDGADACPSVREDGVAARGGDPRDGCPRGL